MFRSDVTALFYSMEHRAPKARAMAVSLAGQKRSRRTTSALSSRVKSLNGYRQLVHVHYQVAFDPYAYIVCYTGNEDQKVFSETVPFNIHHMNQKLAVAEVKVSFDCIQHTYDGKSKIQRVLIRYSQQYRTQKVAQGSQYKATIEAKCQCNLDPAGSILK